MGEGGLSASSWGLGCVDEACFCKLGLFTPLSCSTISCRPGPLPARLSGAAHRDDPLFAALRDRGAAGRPAVGQQEAGRQRERRPAGASTGPRGARFSCKRLLGLGRLRTANFRPPPNSTDPPQPTQTNPPQNLPPNAPPPQEVLEEFVFSEPHEPFYRRIASTPPRPLAAPSILTGHVGRPEGEGEELAKITEVRPAVGVGWGRLLEAVDVDGGSVSCVMSVPRLNSAMSCPIRSFVSPNRCGSASRSRWRR
jgi:hypothetical protein